MESKGLSKGLFERFHNKIGMTLRECHKEWIETNISAHSKVSSRINQYRTILSARNVGVKHHRPIDIKRRIRSISPAGKPNILFQGKKLRDISP
mmetsp:Transcript_26887/g.23736  ORF Transcript_26887/g.23736 Transcript_26887/m.23736 type:complete len:94 (+) Transcript_26887:723-1004(+)